METWIIKVIAMITMFTMIIAIGNIPLRSKTFKTNQKILSLTSAFSGGLFLAVGLLHLMPEADENIQNQYNKDSGDHFPWCNFITITSFAFILFIEKIAAKHSHSHDIEAHTHDIKVQSSDVESFSTPPSLKQQLAKDDINFTPFILQIAIGIHAIFEGIAIGIETSPIRVFSIAIAVACHKWAEGLTLGLAFKKANTDLTISTIMITLQAIINPIGIGIGWILSNQGDLIAGIFMSISAGTFIYIATIEVIVEEFNNERYNIIKFLFFLVAIGFVCSLWFIEQSTGA